MNDEIDLGSRYNTRQTLRPWRPGDGLTCSFANRASRVRPCGRPVAVRTSERALRYPGATGQRQRRVVCAYHLSDQISPGDVAAAAERAAREKVVAEHWDEYQAAIQEFAQAGIEEMISQFPDELKALIVKALAVDVAADDAA